MYNFSNIRYAAPPLGDRRFRAPVWPEQNRTHVQDGSVGRVCPQATPIWELDIEPAFLLSLVTGTKFNQSTNISSYPYVPAKLDPRTTEDCLFLDVVAPKKIFDRAQDKSYVPKQKLAPVLVWIYGGGYVGGEKSVYDPSGLIQRSMVVGEGIVYVAMNYRVSCDRYRRFEYPFSSNMHLAGRIRLAWWRYSRSKRHRQCRASRPALGLGLGV